MTINLFQTAEYKSLMTEHISKTVSYLFEKQQEFSLACEVKHIDFSPELPSALQKSFDEVVMFVLAGYTYESAHLDDEYFSFEAGFGSDNFGSTVTIPLLAIKQVFVSDHPIVMNLAKHSKKKDILQKDSIQEAKNTSMKTLLNNPENKKLLKRNK